LANDSSHNYAPNTAKLRQKNSYGKSDERVRTFRRLGGRPPGRAVEGQLWKTEMLTEDPSPASEASPENLRDLAEKRSQNNHQ